MCICIKWVVIYIFLVCICFGGGGVEGIGLIGWFGVGGIFVDEGFGKIVDITEFDLGGWIFFEIE